MYLACVYYRMAANKLKKVKQSPKEVKLETSRNLTSTQRGSVKWLHKILKKPVLK